MIDVTLEVDGKEYRGWQEMEITRGMEQIAGSFTLSVSDKWHGQDKPWPILNGDACQVWLGSTPVITGYVDDADPEYDDKSHGLHVSGRDATGDLVDCSAIYKSGQWTNAGLLKIAKDLCSPFGIAVTADVDLGKPFKKFALQESETCFEALERAARQRAVLLLSDGNGELLLTRASTQKINASLIQGENVERAKGKFSHKDRFSDYFIKGQSPGGSDIWTGASVSKHTQQKATAKDDAVRRYRPLIIIADRTDGVSYQDRANWERNVRAGKAARIEYVATGWEYKTDCIWPINKMVPVQDDYIGINEDLIIARVVFTLNSGGSQTRLEVCRREAFDLVNLPNSKSAAASGKTSIKTRKDKTIKTSDKDASKW